MPRPANTLHTDQLRYDAASQTLGADASMVEHHLGTRSLPTRINVVSARTGQTRTFDFARVRTDDEGDILAWVYGCGSLRLIIINT